MNEVLVEMSRKGEYKWILVRRNENGRAGDKLDKDRNQEQNKGGGYHLQHGTVNKISVSF